MLKAAATCLLLTFAAAFFAGCGSTPLLPWEQPPKSPLVEEHFIQLMGSRFRVRLWLSNANPRNPQRRAFWTAFNELKRVATIADDTKPDSEVSRVNGYAGRTSVRVSPDLLKMLVLGLQMWKLTGGLFDVTFAPIQDQVERFGPDAGLDAGVYEFAPDVSATINHAVGTKYLVVDPVKSEVRFINPAIRLGLLGLAKGYAIEKAAEKLMPLNLPGFAVIVGSGGGGIQALSGAALKDPALMCLEHPNSLGVCAYGVLPDRPGKVLYLGQGSSEGRPGHMYDPKNGLRKARPGPVFVAGSNGAIVQAATTAGSLMDNQKADSFFASGGPMGFNGVFYDSDYGVTLHGSLEPWAKTSPLHF